MSRASKIAAFRRSKKDDRASTMLVNAVAVKYLGHDSRNSKSRARLEPYGRADARAWVRIGTIVCSMTPDCVLNPADAELEPNLLRCLIS